MYPPAEGAPWRLAIAAVVAAFVLSCVYFSGVFPPFSNPNDLSRFQVVVAFVETGSFSIDSVLATLGDREDKAASGGRFYSNKAPGLALAAIPLYRLLRFFLPPPDSATGALFVLLRLPTVSLVCVVALARFARRLSRHRDAASVAPLVAFAAAFGTPLLYYARSFFSHAWTASLLFLAWDLLRGEGGGPPRERRGLAAAGAGLLAGWAAISEYTVAPVAVLLAVRAASGRRWRTLLLFGAGAALPLALLFVYQAICFGSPFLPSYSREAYPAYAELARRSFFGFGPPSGKVVLEYLFHPARGVLVFSPFFLWAVPGFVRWFRSGRERADCAFAAAAVVVSILFLSGYPNWHGGWALGSRYLLPLVFLAAAALPWALGGALSRGLFAAAVVFSAGNHVLSTLAWPHFPLEVPFPPAGVSSWFLARGWGAPNLASSTGALWSLVLPAAAAAAALVLALRAARPCLPRPWVAAVLGAGPLLALLLRPPEPSFEGRLWRASIYGAHSGRDPERAELREVVTSASTPFERWQAVGAWRLYGPRR